MVRTEEGIYKGQPPQPPPQPAPHPVAAHAEPLTVAPEALVESLDIPSAQKKIIAAKRDRVTNTAHNIKTTLANSSNQPPLPPPPWCLVNSISFHCLPILYRAMFLWFYVCLCKLK
ncbi:hypothetical protein QL285_054518 [Trifolium repens]|nr:hypothetical protein QL285_054518 [Trifolium repens]